MKSTHPIITLLGSNSGNNLGDAAILSSIMHHLTRELPNAEFFVPTTKPSFVNEQYGDKFNVHGLNMMPWTVSLRFVGVPTFWALAQSDVALICDGIIFGKKLWNPFFNWLIALIFVVPFARLVGCKVVCYSCGIGPFPSKISALFAKWVLNGCDLVIMREHDSKKLAEAIGCTKEIEVTGDAAFINPVSDDNRAQEIAKTHGIDLTKPILGINVTKYLDTWLKADEQVADRSSFISLLAEGIERAKKEIGTTFQSVIFCTHPMDEGTCNELAAKVTGKVITNTEYLSHDIQAVMRRCDLFIGMRFHSLILASAVEVPIIGLIYAPKVRGYMRLLHCEDYGLELGKLSVDSLAQALVTGWQDRETLKQRQKSIIDGLKEGALRAAKRIRERYYE